MFDEKIDQAINEWAYMLTSEEKESAKRFLEKTLKMMNEEGLFPANLQIIHTFSQILIKDLEKFFSPRESNI